MKALTLAALTGLFLLCSCSSTDETVADYDRQLNERDAEIESLRKRSADDEALRMITAREMEEAAARAAAAEAELQRLRMAENNAQARLSEREREMQRRLEEEKRRREAEVAKAREVRPASTKGMEVLSGANGSVVMRLDNGVTFSSGSADLSKSGKALLRGAVANALAQYPGHQLSIEGHTDDTPVKKSRWGNNMNLSIARALAVQTFLNKSVGIPKDRMSVAGYADARPVVNAKTKAARAKNRRVEIVVLRNSSN